MLFPLNKTKLNDMINDKIILITGGTSWTFQRMVQVLLEEFTPKKIIIYSRDEYKQSLMQKIFPRTKYSCLRYFIGCVRDKERLEQAFENADIIFHAAALKQVDTIEYNPDEGIKTNVDGTRNVITCAKKCNVKYVVGISTDKSSNPACLYGASKYCAEKLLIAANNTSGGKTKFCAVRYGNVLFSRGSVGEIFLEQKKNKVLTITDKRMTRFTITAAEAIRFSLNCLADMIGGEVFVPKIPSYNILQLAKVLGPECEIKEIGLRPGEKLHESMVADYESYLAIEDKDRYIITPTVPFFDKKKYQEIYGDKICPENWEYRSDENEYIFDLLLNQMLNDYLHANSL
jgi:UDP-N-acetylglucosamine 4,6-dehydratase/5-epimerase